MGCHLALPSNWHCKAYKTQSSPAAASPLPHQHGRGTSSLLGATLRKQFYPVQALQDNQSSSLGPQLFPSTAAPICLVSFYLAQWVLGKSVSYDFDYRAFPCSYFAAPASRATVAGGTASKAGSSQQPAAQNASMRVTRSASKTNQVCGQGAVHGLQASSLLALILRCKWPDDCICCFQVKTSLTAKTLKAAMANARAARFRKAAQVGAAAQPRGAKAQATGPQTATTKASTSVPKRSLPRPVARSCEVSRQSIMQPGRLAKGTAKGDRRGSAGKLQPGGSTVAKVAAAARLKRVLQPKKVSRHAGSMPRLGTLLQHATACSLCLVHR
jgi:hypothetical protein